MYTFSSRLKTFAFILMAIGALGIGYGFYMAPKTTADVEVILKGEAAEHHGGLAESDTHAAAGETHGVSAPHKDTAHASANNASTSNAIHNATISKSSNADIHFSDQHAVSDNTGHHTMYGKVASHNHHDDPDKHI